MGHAKGARVSMPDKESPRVVLVAEDEALVRLAIANHLRAAGFDVLEAANGEDALELLEEHGTGIGAVFADIRLAKLGTDGMGLALWINSTLPDLPVVLTSGVFGAPQGLVEGESFFRKPYKFEAIAARLNKLTSRSQAG